jgi:hypothetical protein
VWVETRRGQRPSQAEQTSETLPDLSRSFGAAPDPAFAGEPECCFSTSNDDGLHPRFLLTATEESPRNPFSYDLPSELPSHDVGGVVVAVTAAQVPPSGAILSDAEENLGTFGLVDQGVLEWDHVDALVTEFFTHGHKYLVSL